MFDVSKSALKRIVEVSKKNKKKFFRISIDGGGCQGFSYKFDFDDKISENDKATNITGTVARPSNPSVKFTALDDPIIIKIPKGIKNKPILRTTFLKKGKYKFDIL